MKMELIKSAISMVYDIYGPGGNNDSHSVTGFNTFISPIKEKVIEIIDTETGEKHIFGKTQKISIKRKNLVGEEENMNIIGSEFREDDVFLGYV